MRQTPNYNGFYCFVDMIKENINIYKVLRNGCHLQSCLKTGDRRPETSETRNDDVSKYQTSKTKMNNNNKINVRIDYYSYYYC